MKRTAFMLLAAGLLLACGTAKQAAVTGVGGVADASLSDSPSPQATACREALGTARQAGEKRDPSKLRAQLKRAVTTATAAAQACKPWKVPLGVALALRGKALFALGDAQQAAGDTWAALGLSGTLDFPTVLSNAAGLAGNATQPGSAEQRLRTIEQLVWGSQTLVDLADQLEAGGDGEVAAQARAASHDLVLARWRLQSSLPGLRAVTAQREASVDDADLNLSTSKGAVNKGAGNPGFLDSGSVAGAANAHLSWPEGQGKVARRLRPAAVRSIVGDLQAHAAARNADTAAWDVEGGLTAVNPLFYAAWGEPYGPYTPQFVPPAAAEGQHWTGRIARPRRNATKALQRLEALSPPVGGLGDLPPTYQHGPTADTSTGRFWEQEMFVAEFEDVYVEGREGVVYDDTTVYLTSHGLHTDLAHHFVGDAGSGAGTGVKKEVTRVPLALSLAQPKYMGYYHFVAEVVPRFMAVLQQLTAAATGSQAEAVGREMADARIMVPMGPPFIGALVSLLAVDTKNMVLLHPDHGVVRADKLLLGDWATSSGRTPPAPVGAVGSQLPPTWEQAEDVLTAWRSSPNALQGFNITTAAAFKLAHVEGGTAADHHAAAWAARGVSPQLWDGLLGGVKPLSEFAEDASDEEVPGAVVPSVSGVGVEVHGEDATLDSRPQSRTAPRSLLQLTRKHLANAIIPAPEPEQQLDTTQEVQRAAEEETGETVRRSRRKRKWKKRSRKQEAKDRAEGKEVEEEWEEAPPAWRTYSGFASPFLWDNGTVLAYPPIRTVLVVGTDVDSPRRLADMGSIMDTVRTFFQEAAEEAHHGGMLPRDAKGRLLPDAEGEDVHSPAVVMTVEAGDQNTLMQMTHPMVWNKWHSDNMNLAASSGTLYERGWLRASAHEAVDAALAKNRTAAVTANAGKAVETLRKDGSLHAPKFTPIPVVEGKITVAAVDMTSMPMAAVVRLYQQADVVVGVSGSGLANLVFSPPTTSVLEVALQAGSSRQIAALAAAMDQDHWTILGQPQNDSIPLKGASTASDLESFGTGADAALDVLTAAPANAQVGEHAAALRVDEEQLRATLSAMLGKRLLANAHAVERGTFARESLWRRDLLRPRPKTKGKKKRKKRVKKTKA